MNMDIKRESKSDRVWRGNIYAKQGWGNGGLCLLNSPQKTTSDLGERELELWRAGRKERGKQPRLTGIEQNHTLNTSKHWLTNRQIYSSFTIEK